MDDAGPPPHATDLAACPRGRVRFGTSSFSSPDWVGPFYPPGTAPGEFLSVYASHFDTVEVDSTYYAVPARRTVEGWARKTPEGFLVSAKFPRSVVHAGDDARPDPAKVLAGDGARRDRDLFLEAMTSLGPRCGPLVLQFPYFGREAFPDPAAFLDRLDAFLADLPAAFSYGVEVRNRAWVGPALATVLRARRVAMVLVDQTWMPHGDEVEARMDPVTGDLAYVRLLGDRKEIEALTTTWDREVVERGDRLARWAALLDRLARRGVASLVYVNNHYAGHAPTTTRRLKALYEERAAADPARPPG